MSERYFFFEREETPDHPAGLTVSKQKPLPKGDFRITEYSWSGLPLWFVDADNFSPDEREHARLAFLAEFKEQP